MSHLAAVKSAERSLKRKQELQQLAAAGDEWAENRLKLNEYQKRYKEKMLEAANSGDHGAQQRLLTTNEKKKAGCVRYRQRRREKLSASHARAVSGSSVSMKSFDLAGDNVASNTGHRESARIAGSDSNAESNNDDSSAREHPVGSQSDGQ